MDEIKRKFVTNLDQYDRLIERLKIEHLSDTSFDSRDIIMAYRKIRAELDKHLANVVLFCKRKMVRDVIVYTVDLNQQEQMVKELQRSINVVNLVGQYLPPLPKMTLDALIQTRGKTAEDANQQPNEGSNNRVLA
jgi:hypothetical protein